MCDLLKNGVTYIISLTLVSGSVLLKSRKYYIFLILKKYDSLNLMYLNYYSQQRYQPHDVLDFYNAYAVYFFILHFPYI